MLSIFSDQEKVSASRSYLSLTRYVFIHRVGLTKAQLLNLAKKSTSRLLQEHAQALDDPINCGTLLWVGMPAASVNLLKKRIHAMNWALATTGHDVLGQGLQAVAVTVCMDQILERRTTRSDFPKDHTKRVDVALDRVSDRSG